MPFTPDLPSPQGLLLRYREADLAIRLTAGELLNATIEPHWISNHSFWYRRQLKDGNWEFILVDGKRKRKAEMFNHEALVSALNKAASSMEVATRLPLTDFEQDGKIIRFTYKNKRWEFDREVREIEKPVQPLPPVRRNPMVSADGRYTAKIVEGKLKINDTIISGAEGIASIEWSPKQNRLLAYQLEPGDRRKVGFYQSSPNEGFSAVLKQRLYDLPGDKLDTYQAYWCNAETGDFQKLNIAPILGGGQPWSGPPSADWLSQGDLALITQMERGYQVFNLHTVDMASGKSWRCYQEREKTFINSSKQILVTMPKSPEFLWRTESSRWAQLIKVNALDGSVTPVTEGTFVVRKFEGFDGAQILLEACGKEKGDPYFRYVYRTGLNGKGWKLLTPGEGNHTVNWSPDRSTLVDTFSQINEPPQINMIDAKSGTVLVSVEKTVLNGKRTLPKPFVAKGRDGVTDIYGIYCLPSHFDPALSYPVIENIYAGPHDSFVPKNYLPASRMQGLAELGFIVVQCDGMGTDNRGKDFHDVCWQNIADAGFPDRIAWMRALAKEVPQADLSRVGVYGTSAGGQSSTGALLFHGDFYKVAVSSCGCHDNRMDKYWWNEQWMGYPVGLHYEAQSNITNAGKLTGDLMLMVGEMDTNVPPESTYRLANALVKSGKNFEFVFLPGMDHTDGGNYGEHKRRDFFVKHLIGVQPPAWR